MGLGSNGPCPLCHVRHSSLRLTAREREVVSHLARGPTNRALAAALGITKNTLRSHLKTIRGKLGAGSRKQIVVVAQTHLLLGRERHD